MSHERWADSAAAYALDSLDAAERTLFESHLSGCAECRHAVQEFRDVAGLLAHAAPNVAVPAGLNARVTELVRKSENGRAAPPARPRLMRSWLALAAGVALAVLGGTWAYRAQLKSDALSERVNALASETAAMDSVLRYLAGREVHVVSLAEAGKKPVMRVFWNHEENRFVVTAFELPPAEAGRTYQLWAIADGKAPASMGTFNTNTYGEATVVLPVSDTISELGFIKLCALTEEPEGGSPAPTETPQFAGEWRHTD